MLRVLGADIRGSSIVEFALMTPMIVSILMGVADFGLAVNEKMRLVSASRAGVQSGYDNSSNVSAITQAVQGATGLNAQSIAVVVSNSCGCADGSTVACGGTCVNGGALRSYVTVAVSENYSLLLNYPGFPNPIMLSASTTLRVN